MKYILIASLLITVAPVAAKPAGPYTPAVGSAERKAIAEVLRAPPESRLTFRHLRVWHNGDRAIAYAEADDGVIDGFTKILTRDRGADWEVAWGDSGGGSDSCAAGALHYAWALDLIRSYRIAPDALFPGITKQTRELEQMAKREPETHCVGDLEGGHG